MRAISNVTVAAVLAFAGSAMAQYGGINSLATAPYWYADFPGSTLTITNNGLPGIRFQDGPFGAGGFTNRHQAAFAVNGNPFLFQQPDSFKMECDVVINGPGITEAGIWIGTAPFFPNSGLADIGQFVLLPDNGGEIAAFGSVLPFFSNNQNPWDNGNPNPPGNMARAARNVSLHMTMVYVGGLTPSMTYGINGVFTGPLNSGGFFPGILNNSLLGVYVQGPNGNPARGNVDVSFSNLVIVPTPASVALLGFGGLIATRRRR